MTDEPEVRVEITPGEPGESSNEMGIDAAVSANDAEHHASDAEESAGDAAESADQAESHAVAAGDAAGVSLAAATGAEDIQRRIDARIDQLAEALEALPSRIAAGVMVGHEVSAQPSSPYQNEEIVPGEAVVDTAPGTQEEQKQAEHFWYRRWGKR